MEKEILIEKLEYLKNNLDSLKETKKRFEKLKDNKEKEIFTFAIAKMVEEIVETAIKINNKILLEKKYFPQSYFESFSKLPSLFSNLDEKFFLKLAETARFRNKVTHEYEKTEKELLNIIPKIIELYQKYVNILSKEFL